MKKLITFILLAVSANSTLLLAQAQNRLEVRGDRLEETENQSTDCRLEDRLKATNQVIGCRLEDRLEAIGYRLEEIKSQTIDDRKVILPSEDQIGQRAEFATNYALPTTNCNNSGTDLSCYLMMNPEEISKAENALGFSGRKPLPPRKTRFSSIEASTSSNQQSSSSTTIVGKRKRQDDEETTEMNNEENALLGKEGEEISWSGAGSSAHFSADYQLKALEAEKAGKMTLATGYREAAATLEQATNCFEEAAEPCAKGGDITLHSQSISSWNWAGKSLQAKADYEAKASEAEEAGNAILAAGYRETGVTLEQAANLFKEAVQAYNEEDHGEAFCIGECWDLAGKSLQAKVDYQAKASEAEEEGKAILPAGYRKAATISEQASNWFKDKVQFYAKGSCNIYNIISFYSTGTLLQLKADYHARASETEEVGKTTLAAGCREAVAIYQKAVDQFEKGELALAKEKKDEKDNWHSAARVIRNSADYQVKASEVEEAGKTQLAAAYRKAAAISQGVAEYYQQAALAYAEEKEDEGNSWNSVAKYLQSKEDNQIKTIRKTAKEESEKSTIQTTDDNNVTSELFLNSKRIDKCKYSVNPVIEYASTNYQSSSNSASSSSSFLSSISDLPSSSAAALPTAYSLQPTASIRPVSRIITALSVCCQKWLAETKSAEGSGKILSDYIIDVVRRGADHMPVKDFEEYWDRVAKAYNLRDYPQALAKIQVAEDIQQAIEYSIKRAESIKVEESSSLWVDTDKRLSTAWGHAVQAMQQLAEYRDQYIQASIISQNLSSKSPSAANAILTPSTPCASSASATLKVGSKLQLPSSISHLSSLTAVAVSTAYSLQPTASIRPAGRIITKIDSHTPELIRGWKKVVEGAESVANYSRKAAEACSLGNEQEYNRFNNAADSARESVRKLKESIKFFERSNTVSTAGESEASTFWRSIAEQWQKSAEYNLQVASALSTGNTTCFNQDCLRGIYSLEQASTSLEKATQARESNQEPIAELWLKTAQQHHELIEYERQAVNARLIRNSLDRSHFYQTVQSVEDSANQLKKTAIQLEEATQGMEVNPREVPELWLETARKYEELTNHYRQAAHERLSENTIDRNYIYQAAQVAHDSLQQLDIAKQEDDDRLEHGELNQREVTALRLKIVKQYQELVEHHLQAIKVLLNKNSIDSDCFHQADVFAQNSARLLKKASSLLDKAKDVKMEITYYDTEGTGATLWLKRDKESTLWLKSAKKYEESAEYECQLANVVLSSDATYDEVFSQEKEIAQKNAHRLEKAAIALEHANSVFNRSGVAAAWGNIAQKYEFAVEFDARAAEEEMKGNREEAVRLREAAKALEKSAETEENEPNIVLLTDY